MQSNVTNTGSQGSYLGYFALRFYSFDSLSAEANYAKDRGETVLY